ncbi:5-methyltetrahydropteroyltriglutamate--homocysteine S-methyltransferase [uncultured Sphaerochaeta sp.]|uniref:5-methyltetrahydropteroyltriglutamate-- homocysteine S-methyltransferase n=1 Tax=uncultured Sphaerochaeta sp. TaxID=886478 RepID=UPI002A0A77EA|nr:5-methyltetrahydropteroyltriglutamate--homocysteine S-methyltransferase [uncultured Sphaerochaeta sp.]
MKQNAPFRADVVGSYLRPESLKQARKAFSEGLLDRESLTAIEDSAIADLVKKQKAAGLSSLTDGEFRRSWWHLDFMWGMEGIGKCSAKTGYKFQGEVTRADSAQVTGRIQAVNHPFVQHFAYLHQFEDDQSRARQTIPAPAQLYAELVRGKNEQEITRYYPDKDLLFDDIAKAYQTVIQGLYAQGCRNVQLDDCTWGMFCDVSFQQKMGWKDADISAMANLYVELNNKALENKPSDLVVTTHVCRGNYHSTWASSGGYEPIAKYLFPQEKVSAFYLEFDTERAGGFEPLRFVPDDKTVVLGLITSKTPSLENPSLIEKRIEDASHFVSIDRLCLSPQCGFASTEEGNILSEEEQWNKVALVRDIAKVVWND